MEDFSFDISGILTEEEAKKLFEESAPADETVDPAANETEVKPAEEQEREASTPEIVGEEDEIEGNAIDSEDDGSSPNVYSSIASALKNDGIFPDFTDEELNAVQSPEDFGELFEKAISARLDERQRRIDTALGKGVQPDTVRMYEQTLQYLGSINDEALSAESEDGENLRKQIIYNDLINRGYSQDKAIKEIEKSFKSGSDIEDAKDALAALNKFYTYGYNKVQEDAKKRKEEERNAQKKQAEAIRKSILEDDLKIGDSDLDKGTRQRVYDAVYKPVYKDPDSGKLLTAVQKFQKENPTEFMKQLGLWYVMTDGGKNMDGLAKKQVRAEKNKAIKELAKKINTTSLKSDGSLRYISGAGGEADPLLSDGWKVGWE